jgi:hypothetical protein
MRSRIISTTKIERATTMMKKDGVLTPKRVLFSAILGTVLALGAGCASTGSQETTGQYFNDSAITSRIKAKLLEDQALQGFQIKVDTYRGHVILSGFVNRPSQIREAVRIARRTHGVVSVRNDLVVKNTTSR